MTYTTVANNGARYPTLTDPKRGTYMLAQFINQYVLVRSNMAGVHIGTLVAKEGKEVTLKDCRRIWSWAGANTLHEVSQKGVTSGRISELAPYLIVCEAEEIIPCTEHAKKTLDRSVWK